MTITEILALIDEVRRHTPSASAEEVAEYARRYRGWTVTADEIRSATA